MNDDLNRDTFSFLSNIETLLKNEELQNLAEVFRYISFNPLEIYHEHKHSRIEMAYVKRGSCIIESDKESVYFKQDEIMIITSNVLHSFQAGINGCTLLQLEFPANIINIANSLNKSLLNSVSIFSKDNMIMKIINNDRIKQTIQRIVTEINDKHDYYKHLVIFYYA